MRCGSGRSGLFEVSALGIRQVLLRSAVYTPKTSLLYFASSPSTLLSVPRLPDGKPHRLAATGSNLPCAACLECHRMVVLVQDNASDSVAWRSDGQWTCSQFDCGGRYVVRHRRSADRGGPESRNSFGRLDVSGDRLRGAVCCRRFSVVGNMRTVRHIMVPDYPRRNELASGRFLGSHLAPYRLSVMVSVGADRSHSGLSAIGPTRRAVV